MGRFATSGFVIVAAGSACAGCVGAPGPTSYASATYHAAGVGVYAVQATGTDLYHGAGEAFRAPLHDLNMMQDQISPVLLRAEQRPYDLARIDSCNDVLNGVAELDLALGPDVDMPKANHRSRASRGADFAAGAAIDAAGSAAEHFIPMRSTIKQLSGATRYENHVKHAVLSGEVRRSFLKAVGMAHSCAWPAAPLNFRPARLTDADLSWSGAPGVRYAAVPPAPAPTSGLTPSGLTTSGLTPSSAPPLRIDVAVIGVPRAAPPGFDAAQSWRPPAGSVRTASLRTYGANSPTISTARFTAGRERMNRTRTTPETSEIATPSPGGVVNVSAPLTAGAVAPWSVGFATAH